MTNKLPEFLIKSMLSLLGLALLGGIWYYGFGRKPTLVRSVPIEQKIARATLCPVGPDELLHISAGKATLYTLPNGEERWSVPLQSSGGMGAATPSTAPLGQSTLQREQGLANPGLNVGAQADPLLASRVEQRFARLTEWAASLNARRATLKTQLEIQTFNVEAAKYHAELAAARAEAAARPASNPTADISTSNLPAMSGGRGIPRAADKEWDDYGRNGFADAVAEGDTILLVHGSQGMLLDRGSGASRKQWIFPGVCSQLIAGSGCAFALCELADGTREVVRISIGDGTMRGVMLAGGAREGRGRMQFMANSSQPSPLPLRTELIASNGSLLQCDIRLIERKITQRAVGGAPNSALEAADRKTATAFGSDALEYARAISADVEREMTGGQESMDESTYSVALTRPFDPGSSGVSLTVHGPPRVFSTESLDIVSAGQSVYVVNHSGRLLWTGNLASPIADLRGWESLTILDSSRPTPPLPCVEGDQLLYVADSTFLTAFDLQGGKPQWRIPVNGIRRLQLDGADSLYASTGESTQKPLLLKVEARTGRVLWQVENYQYCIVSDRQVYATREVVNAEDAVNRVFQSSKAIECRWKLYKLAASDGKPQWEWFQTRRPRYVLTHGKKVALLFSDELQVLKSMAL